MTNAAAVLDHEQPDVFPAAPLYPVARLARDVKLAAALLDREQGRYLVDLYYQLQDYRKALANQVLAAEADGEPATIAGHFGAQLGALESQMVGVLDKWTDEHAVARWAKGQYGIGPILAAGLLAYIDIERAATAGAIWRYAGLDPTVTWGKGEKRPWNAQLKVLCWKIGDSFRKFSNRDGCVYGQQYRQRKAYEVERNESGGNAAAAARSLAERNIADAKLRETLEGGRLPDGQIDQRAARWAVKLFLSHYHDVAYRDRYGKPPPSPYPIAHLGHAHTIPAPPLATQLE